LIDPLNSSASTMLQLSLSKLKSTDLKPLIQLQEHGIGAYFWLQTENIVLSPPDLQQLQLLQNRLLNERTLLMNEATIWARAIYPILLLAEQDSIQTWAQVELSSQYKNFSLSGIADAVVGLCLEGELKTPYFIVVEAKRGLEAENPKYQLYGQILAAASLNWQENAYDPQELYGCYTVADTWTFIRATIAQLDSDRPILTVESSRDYVEKLEAPTILKILKGIIDRAIVKPDRAENN
jgi:hypothetical protein